MKKILAIVFVIAMLFSLAACGDKTPAPTADPGISSPPAPTATPAPAGPKVLKVAHKADPTALFHLAVSNTSSNGPVHCFISEMLVNFDSTTNEFKPALATEWKFIDNLHLEFKLREGVKAHDGSDIKASDVIWTFKTGQDSGKLANYYGGFDMDESKVVDDYTVILALKNPNPYVLYTLANTACGIVSESAATKTGNIEDQNEKPNCGAGPYKVVSWDRGATIVLERFDDYWGEKPYFDTVEIKIITDASARLLNLEAGDVDIALDPIIAQAIDFEGNDDFTVANVENATCNLFLMNCKDFAPFTDVKVRQAMALAIDYENDVEIATAGYGYVTDSLIPNRSPAYAAPDGSYENYFRYDVEAAKAKLAESSYPDGFTFTLKYMENAIFTELAQLVKNQLAVIGITAELAPTASSVFYTDASAGNFHIYLAATSNPDPLVHMNYFDGRISFQQARGGCGWQGPERLNELIDLAKQETDDTIRNGYFKEIQSIINENVPAITVGSQNRVTVYDSDLDGVRYTPFSDVDLSHAFLK